VSKKLFVSFAESDGGHSYLAARAMLKPSHIAHLVFRTSVADSLDAVASGQANFTIVPAYNSITQWEGATLKALATGQFEIFAQVCMPTSYVLVAHRDYMLEFVNAYIHLREPHLDPTAEEAAKIYTRFLTRIFVGAQADEQYRGRLVRPDISHASVELSRNPLRVLEEMSRTELFKAMAAQAPLRGGQGGLPPLPPGVSGGTINIGATPVLAQQPITVGPQGAPTGTVSLMELQAPAALVAAGLLEAPGDPTGWEQDGSLGEIISVLRKLLVLLNVNAFGAPDLPDNKTQYFLIGRKGATLPADALGAPEKIPDDAPTRIMTLVRPTSKTSSADRWIKPRNLLTKRARDHGFVFDRPPLMLSPGNVPVYLFEGGKPRSGVSPNPIGIFENFLNWLARTFAPGDEKKEKAKAAKTLRTALEKKQDKKSKDGSPEKFEISFLGQYQTWCPEPHSSTTTCWCCEEAHIDKQLEETGVGIGPLIQFLIAGLIAVTALAILITPIYCTMTGSCAWFGGREPTFEPRVEPPPATQTEVTPPATQTPPPSTTGQAPSKYPGVDTTKPAVVTAPAPKDPVVAPQPPKVDVPKPPPVFHVAFFEAKANLTPEAMTAIASAATQFVQMNRSTNIRLVSLGPRESDGALWQRRLYAVKDELVRLGVPAGRIRYEGTGPYLLMIRSTQPTRPAGSSRRRSSQYLDAVPDPMSGET
jgi:outer membrane protein OmpA-like peptidoglycan-associated protein